jgi:predicted Zn-dependent peptidase
MTDPALAPADVEAERQVILDEILMHGDEPADLAAEQCTGAMFAGHPLGREVLGVPDSVGALGVEEIRRFFDAHYRTGNMVVAAAGDLDHDDFAAEVDRRFAARRGGAAPARTPPVVVPGTRVITTRPTEQAHLVVGIPAPGRFSEDRWALSVLNHALGGGMSSRLFQEIRERRGLAYSVWSDRTHFEEAGMLSVSVGTAPEHAGEVLGLVHEELDRMGESGITERELAVAKGHLRAETLLSLEDSGARMSRVGSSLLLHGRVLSLDELLGKVEGVSAEDVNGLAAKLAAEPRTLSVVGPFSDADFAIAG